MWRDGYCAILWKLNQVKGRTTWQRVPRCCYDIFCAAVPDFRVQYTFFHPCAGVFVFFDFFFSTVFGVCGSGAGGGGGVVGFVSDDPLCRTLDGDGGYAL